MFATQERQKKIDEERERRTESLRKKRQTRKFGEVTSTLSNWKVMSQRWMLERTLEGKREEDLVSGRELGVCVLLNDKWQS